MPPKIEDIRLSELIKPTPKQREAFAATDKFRFVLYGGAAGGGKSYMLRWWCLRQLLKRYAETGIPKLVAGLFSIDYPTLQDRQISKIEREFPAWLGEVKRTEKEGLCFFVKEEYGGGRIALRNLADASSYKSAEFCDIAVEELTENKRDVFEDLVLFRLRTPGIERCCFLGGTNPTGSGLQWVKALWVDRRYPDELKHLAKEFCYVPALLQDNPYLGPAYEEALRGLPTKKRRALLEGDWSIPEGQYFTNFERSRVAVHPEVMKRVMRDWWPRWISQDWGFKHHSPVHWHTTGDVLPEDAKLLGRDWDVPKKCVFTYRELIAGGPGGDPSSLADAGMTEAQLAEKICDLTGKEKLRAYVLSSDAFAKENSMNTPAQMISAVMKAHKHPTPHKADMSPGSRAPGWRYMHQLLQEDSWFISEMCPEALNAIPALEYDKDKGGEDVLKTDTLFDDVGDELRYGMVYMLRNAKKPRDIVIREKIEATADPLQQHFIRLAETERRQKAQQPRGWWE